MTRERRKSARVPQEFAARFRLRGELGESWHEVTLQNLSMGGLRFRSDQALEPDAAVEVEIRLPSLREPLRLGGRVAWSSMQASGVVECGMAFEALSPERQLEIDRVVEFLRGR